MARPNVDKRSHSFGQRVGRLTEDTISIAVIGFAVLGLGGTLYKALKPGGWLSAALDRIWNESPLLVWLIGFIFAGVLALARWWLMHDRNPGGRSDVLAYAFEALGLFFFFKLVVTGSL
jgi:hypothetical protein